METPPSPPSFEMNGQPYPLDRLDWMMNTLGRIEGRQIMIHETVQDHGVRLRRLEVTAGAVRPPEGAPWWLTNRALWMALLMAAVWLNLIPDRVVDLAVRLLGGSG